MGYAFIKNPDGGLLAYGPGRFEAAYEQIDFEAGPDGQIRVKMFFAANRPDAVARITLDPFAFAVRATSISTGGLADRLAHPFELAYRRLRLPWPTFDPVYGFVALANLLTFGQAERQACISRDQLDRDFLVQHFQQHYQAVAGALVTWRSILDWTAEAGIPGWIRTGVGS